MLFRSRAQKKGVLTVRCHQIREYTDNRQKQVDDYPYGGGMGLVMYAQPIDACFRAVCEQAGTRPHLIYLTPQAPVLTQERAKELAQLPNLCLLCGHYEGVDERVLEDVYKRQAWHCPHHRPARHLRGNRRRPFRG